MIEDIIFWMLIPTVRLTEESKSKFVRVIGFLGGFITVPLAAFPALILSVPMIYYESYL